MLQDPNVEDYIERRIYPIILRLKKLEAEVEFLKNEKNNSKSRIRSFMMPIRWFEKMFCKHTHSIELSKNPRDDYTITMCPECGKVVYKQC
jgi:predicted  nucleic acid-binding Zn-ribbon protein